MKLAEGKVITVYDNGKTREHYALLRGSGRTLERDARRDVEIGVNLLRGDTDLNALVRKQASDVLVKLESQRTYLQEQCGKHWEDSIKQGERLLKSRLLLWTLMVACGLAIGMLAVIL